MKLFRRAFRDKSGLSEVQQQAALNIAGKILRCQRKTADYLNRKTAKISAKGWLVILIAFCAGFGSYCLLLLIRAFN